MLDPTYPSYGHRLQAAVEKTGVPWAIGLDPNPALIPADFHTQTRLNESVSDHTSPAHYRAKQSAYTALNWCREVLESVGDYVTIVKPQVAWFESFGSYGIQALEGILAEFHNNKIFTIGDAKRGDIGVSSAAYAQAWLSADSTLRVDSVTVQPWVAADGLLPFAIAALENKAGFYMLVRTSNPRAEKLQKTLIAPDTESVSGPANSQLYELIADELDHLCKQSLKTVGDTSKSSTLKEAQKSFGAVIGANAITEAETLREKFPHTPFLVPGLGAQGHAFDNAKAFLDNEGYGAVFPTSRAVMFPPGIELCTDKKARAALFRAAAERFIESLQKVI